ncbi:hypothetical protein VNO78_10482 [Psophocarpus tetragonolobus]|uniref:Uncharacterized protein n=1 Tax=Psophocarpus tetragonolobus TaxID=3891 RepID=A0AAN9SKN7_PSOTE
MDGHKRPFGSRKCITGYVSLVAVGGYHLEELHNVGVEDVMVLVPEMCHQATLRIFSMSYTLTFKESVAVVEASKIMVSIVESDRVVSGKLRNGFYGGKAEYTSSTAAKLKAYGGEYVKRDFVPIYVAIGMIALSTGLGLHTAWQELRNSPAVSVRKKRRETVAEVVDPEQVAEEADNYVKKSFFRKVAHVQERTYPDHNSIREDAYACPPRLHTLKSVGVHVPPLTK